MAISIPPPFHHDSEPARIVGELQTNTSNLIRGALRDIADEGFAADISELVATWCSPRHYHSTDADIPDYVLCADVHERAAAYEVLLRLSRAISSYSHPRA